MRTSRTSSETQKSVYPKCNIKKEHAKESLSLICLTKTCKFAGPICVLCKSKDHSGHAVQPIKSFINQLSQLQKSTQLDKSTIIEEVEVEKVNSQEQVINHAPKDQLSQATDSFHEVLALLKIQVTQISKQIELLEACLLEEYENCRKDLIQEANKHQLIQEVLDLFRERDMPEALQMRKSLERLTKSVKVGPKNQIKIQDNSERILKEYTSKLETTKENIFILANELGNIFENLTQKGLNQQVEILRPRTAVTTVGKGMKGTFSVTLKASNIILEKENSMAKLKDNNGNKVALLHSYFSAKQRELCLQIVKMDNSIGIGLGLKDKLKHNLYKVDKSKVGHGVFLLNGNGYKFSHSDSKENMALASGVSFKTGDEIRVVCDEKEKKLIYYKKGSNEKLCEISLKSLSQELWKELEFCVCFGTMGEKVKILD